VTRTRPVSRKPQAREPYQVREPHQIREPRQPVSRASPRAAPAREPYQASPTKEHQMADLRFDGRVAIVTGAGLGLGPAHALDLAARGANVVVNDLGGALDGTGASSGPTSDVAEEIRKSGGVAVPNRQNVATPEGAEAIVATAVCEFGRVDIVVNNAGILRGKSFLKMAPAEFDAVIAVHLRGSFLVTHAAWPHLRAQV
jgi:NAD(P)-dependent dehydrogenase (short-subunit alcohol dehydrogenase family)